MKIHVDTVGGVVRRKWLLGFWMDNMNDIVEYSFDGTNIYHQDCVDPIESLGWESKACFYFEHMFDFYDAGDFRDTPELRRFALEYSLRNLVKDGICLTAGHNKRVDDLLGWKMVDLAHEYGCTVEPIPQDLKDLTPKKFTESDCIITKW